MRLFLDTSVLLAAAGSSTGSSYALFTHATSQQWLLQSSPWVLDEVVRNLPKLPTSATTQWGRLRPQLAIVNDVLVLDRPTIFPASKDRPVLFSALASSDALLTLDKTDFADLLGSAFYGLKVMLPYEFLHEHRTAGRLLD